LHLCDQLNQINNGCHVKESGGANNDVPKKDGGDGPKKDGGHDD
jgi:hypothetical protein